MEDVAPPRRWLARWGPVLLLAAAIFVVSSLEPGQLPGPEELFRYDKLLHGAAYALLGGLTFRALAHRGWARATGLAFLVAALYGLSDELHQMLTPGRDASGLDWIADAVGGLAGSQLGWLIARARR